MNAVFDPVLASASVLLAMMIIAALAVARTVNLFAVALLSGVVSLLAAAWFILLDAPDVAFTEASVGAGVATALYVAALAHTGDRARRRGGIRAIGAAIAVSIFAVALFLIVPFTPTFGDPLSAPATRVGAIYVQTTPLEIGIPNVVTAVLASYRGLDTLGETVLIFAAAVAVATILPRDRKRRRDENVLGDR